MEERNIKFVASRYREGAFSVEKAWRKTGLARRPWWSRSKIAAAMAVVLFLSATATVIVHRYSVKDTAETEIVAAEQEQSPTNVVRAIDFDNAPLTTVVEEIKTVYGVDVANLPPDAGSLYLTLHYEGNAVDLVGQINEILDTSLEIMQ